MVTVWLYETSQEDEGKLIVIQSVDDISKLFDDDRIRNQEPEIVIGIVTDRFRNKYSVPSNCSWYIEIYNGYRE